jgi:hypothetical protein
MLKQMPDPTKKRAPMPVMAGVQPQPRLNDFIPSQKPGITLLSKRAHIR